MPLVLSKAGAQCAPYEMVHEFKPDLMIEEKIPIAIARANRLPDSIRSFDPYKKWWAVPTLQMYKVELRACLNNRRQSRP